MLNLFFFYFFGALTRVMTDYLGAVVENQTIGAEGLKFDLWACQIEHCVTNDSLLL